MNIKYLFIIILSFNIFAKDINLSNTKIKNLGESTDITSLVTGNQVYNYKNAYLVEAQYARMKLDRLKLGIIEFQSALLSKDFFKRMLNNHYDKEKIVEKYLNKIEEYDIDAIVEEDLRILNKYKLEEIKLKKYIDNNIERIMFELEDNIKSNKIKFTNLSSIILNDNYKTMKSEYNNLVNTITALDKNITDRYYSTKNELNKYIDINNDKNNIAIAMDSVPQSFESNQVMIGLGIGGVNKDIGIGTGISYASPEFYSINLLVMGKLGFDIKGNVGFNLGLGMGVGI